MQTFKDLYDRACKKGKLRKDEYSTGEYIADVNDLARRIWTKIFQGVDGNKPNIERSETFTVTDDLEHVQTRTIKKTPIQKIVFEEYHVLKQKTDKILNSYGESCLTTFEYDDDEIRFDQSANGTYKVYYESPKHVELTQVLYDDDEAPDWLKDDFTPIFWAYPAFLNTDTRKDEMDRIYQEYLLACSQYYSRTETLEENVMKADDAYPESQL